MPNHYRGIYFRDWLELFCEYALCLAKCGRNREAYDICEAAINSILFCLSREDMFKLHINYCMCALIANDSETCVGLARWFMLKYQFTTDTYRLFSAVTRMVHAPVSWYNAAPTQKFILRQVKAMDFSLATDDRKTMFGQEKSSYSRKDDNGKPVMAEDFDIALLMMYGYILAVGQSYKFALNYFYRAYALAPENPVVNLSLGLMYVHHGLKRQTANRQFELAQGLTFMHSYYDTRKDSADFCERQEARYNMGRVYHLLGMVHLAIPYYRMVLKGVLDNGEARNRQDWAREAAYNLQSLYTVAGNMELAEAITKKWLVI